MAATTSGSAQGSKKVTCRQCQRAFGSVQALNQHKASVNHSQPMRRSERVDKLRSPMLDVVNPGKPPNMVLSKDLDNMLRDAQLTPAGVAYVKRVCHPNDDTVSGGVMMPDDSGTERVPMELRQYQVLACPYTPTSAGGLENWDVMFCVLPHSDASICYRTKKSVDNTWSPWNLIAVDDALYPGKITAGTPEASWANISVPSVRADYTGFRQICKGVTIEHNRPTLYDQGIVTSGQWASQSGVAVRVPPYFGVSPETDISTLDQVPCYTHEGIPLDEGDIIRICSNAGQWEAKKGVYMPMRYRDPANQLTMEEDLIEVKDVNNQIKQQSVGAIIQLRDIRSGNDTYLDFRAVRYSPTNPTFDTKDLAATGALANQTMGVIHFKGISMLSSLVIKVRTCVEVVPKETNPLRTTVKAPPPADMTACTLVRTMQSKLPVSFEHKYNSMGMLLPLLGKVAGAVLPSVAPWLFGKLRSLFGRSGYQEEPPE